MAIVHDHASYTIHNRNNPYNKCVCTTTEMYKFVCHFLPSDIRYVFNTIFKKKKNNIETTRASSVCSLNRPVLAR